MQTCQITTRISLSNILVTTDFSEASKLALPYAIAITRQYDAKIFVAHVVGLDPLPIDADPLWQDAGLHLAKFVKTDLLDGTEHESLLERGDLWNVISDIIEKNKIDLVVAGSYGRQHLSKPAMGSNAEKIYRRQLVPC